MFYKRQNFSISSGREFSIIILLDQVCVREKKMLIDALFSFHNNHLLFDIYNVKSKMCLKTPLKNHTQSFQIFISFDEPLGGTRILLLPQTSWRTLPGFTFGRERPNDKLLAVIHQVRFQPV